MGQNVFYDLLDIPWGGGNNRSMRGVGWNQLRHSGMSRPSGGLGTVNLN
jgi:hypothetical protein